MSERYTIKQLENPSNIATTNKHYLTDLQILRDLAIDRLGRTTNMYSPLSNRLSKIIVKLDKMIEKHNRDL